MTGGGVLLFGLLSSAMVVVVAVVDGVLLLSDVKDGLEVFVTN